MQSGSVSDPNVHAGDGVSRLRGLEPRASQFDLTVDRRLAAIGDRALALDAGERFPTAEAFRLAIATYLDETGQRVDSGMVRQAIVQRFAAQREALHRMIGSYIKRDSHELSHVSTTVLGTEPGNENRTVVTDRSKYLPGTGEDALSGMKWNPKIDGRLRSTNLALGLLWRSRSGSAR